MLLLVCPISSYAYEIIDTDGDGVDDTVRFSDGYCDPLENYTSYIVSPEGGIPCIETERIEKVDENCKKTPGYIQKEREKWEAIRQEYLMHQANEAALDELKKQIIAQCTNDSMSLIEKVQALLTYLKSNYEVDKSAPDYQYGVNTKYYNGLVGEFLTKERVMNEKNYRQAITELICSPRAEDMIRKFILKDNEDFAILCDRNYATLLRIEGKWYSFDLITLEIEEGFSEQVKKNILEIAEGYIANYGSDLPINHSQLNQLPEDIKQYVRDHGYNLCD